LEVINMQTCNTLKFRPVFDRLEERCTPAGNVTAVFTAATATLTLTGDALANGVDISVGSGGLSSFGVTGVVDGTATTVNNQATTQTFNGVKNLVINLGGGNDSLQFGVTTAGTIIVQGNLTINTGTGNDTILTGGGANFLDVFGALSVTNGAGNSSTTLTNINVVGAAKLNHTAGGTTSLFISTGGTTANSLSSLSVTNGTGNTDIFVIDTNVSGNVTLNTGATPLVNGMDQVVFEAGNSTNLLKIGGSLSINGTIQSGEGIYDLQDYNVNGNVTMTQGGGGNLNLIEVEDLFSIAQSPVIKGNVSLTQGGSNPITDIGGGGNAFVIQGGLTVNQSSGKGAGFAQLDDLASVGNTSLTGGITVKQGNGNFTLAIDNTGSGSTFNGNVSITQGSGNDLLQVNGFGNSPTFFFGTVNANQGSGNDTLQLGLNGPVNFFKSATFSGGSAANDINNLIQEVFANTTGGPVVPTLIHYHP
jgi:hypothetical protein